MATSEHNVYKIGGVSVYFPCKPYPSQFSMMDKIIRGIDRGQNCLLESPTGSGKSLAMLCSALGWQAEQIAKKNLEEGGQELQTAREDCCCQCHSSLPPAVNHLSPPPPAVPFTPPYNTGSKTMVGVRSREDEMLEEDEDDDFKDESINYRTPNIHKEIKKMRKHVTISYEDDYTPVKQGDNSSSTSRSNQDHPVKEGDNCSSTNKVDQDDPVEEKTCNCCSETAKNRIRVPKIYFGTRTHKQVSQIVRELKKTAYHDVRMTILGSREYTCIHPAISKTSNKNEGCTELLKGAGCRNFDRTKRLESQTTIKALGLDSAWDLEDLVSLCKKTKACPYFLSRGLKQQAELIICPYNYLIDPIIREAMEVNLKEQILIFDEAHNIEDSSREAASQTIHVETLEKLVREIDMLVDLNVKVGDHLRFKQMAVELIEFIHHNSESMEQKDFDQSCKIWSGFDIVAQLQSIHLGPSDFPDLIKSLSNISEEVTDEMKQRLGHDGKLSPAMFACIEQIFLVCKNMYSHDMKFVQDYRTSLLKTTSYVSQNTNGQWLNPKQRKGNRLPVISYTLNFWCMSPAVAFSALSDCRCIILSSGTLSPMSSFQSELGLPFPIQLEANHVIKDNQVWVGAIGQGPSGSSLQAVYKNLETYTFQDELGELVLHVCHTVPHGVLCFLPSYKVLEKLTQRWKITGLWSKIELRKKIVCEPRGKDKDDFEDLMKYFYQAIDKETESDSDDEGREITGALFFAVCRGKVSEGLDFADNFARAVISVGIPYPNFKDLQVELKRKYNDQHRVKKGLLSGGEWYEIQAFRALNQALGRCIRHRRDWGSLILVDDRFVKNGQKYCKGLSKWVRNKVKIFRDFSSGMKSLSEFIEDRLDNHDNDSRNESFISSTPVTPVAHTGTTSCSLDPPASQHKSLYSINQTVNSSTPLVTVHKDNSHTIRGTNTNHIASIFKLSYTPTGNRPITSQAPVTTTLYNQPIRTPGLSYPPIKTEDLTSDQPIKTENPTYDQPMRKQNPVSDQPIKGKPPTSDQPIRTKTPSNQPMKTQTVTSLFSNRKQVFLQRNQADQWSDNSKMTSSSKLFLNCDEYKLSCGSKELLNCDDSSSSKVVLNCEDLKCLEETDIPEEPFKPLLSDSSLSPNLTKSGTKQSLRKPLFKKKSTNATNDFINKENMFDKGQGDCNKGEGHIHQAESMCRVDEECVIVSSAQCEGQMGRGEGRFHKGEGHVIEVQGLNKGEYGSDVIVVKEDGSSKVKGSKMEKRNVKGRLSLSGKGRRSVDELRKGKVDGGMMERWINGGEKGEMIPGRVERVKEEGERGKDLGLGTNEGKLGEKWKGEEEGIKIRSEQDKGLTEEMKNELRRFERDVEERLTEGKSDELNSGRKKEVEERLKEGVRDTLTDGKNEEINIRRNKELKEGVKDELNLGMNKDLVERSNIGTNKEVEERLSDGKMDELNQGTNKEAKEGVRDELSVRRNKGKRRRSGGGNSRQVKKSKGVVYIDDIDDDSTGVK